MVVRLEGGDLERHRARQADRGADRRQVGVRLVVVANAVDDRQGQPPRLGHGRTDVGVEAQRNRLLLMGLMTAAGWDFYRNEWWHYQLFDARRYPLVGNADLPRPMM